MNAFSIWLEAQPRGAAAELVRRTGLSNPTINRAKNGLPVSRETAELIAGATRGQVRVSDIPHVRLGRRRRRQKTRAAAAA